MTKAFSPCATAAQRYMMERTGCDERTIVLVQTGAKVLRVSCGEEGAHAACEQVAYHERALEAHPLVRLEAL